jgi:hypothetical protein
MHIPQKKRGVAATVSYPYVGLTYVNVAVAKNGHRYHFTINIMMITIVIIMMLILKYHRFLIPHHCHPSIIYGVCMVIIR